MGVIISVILILLAAALVFLNIDAMVQLNLWFTQMNVPLWTIMVGFLAIGLIAAWLMALSKGNKNREKLKDQEDKIRIADKTKEESVDQAKQDSKSELIKKNAEIDGLKKQVDRLEDELNKQLPSSTADVDTVVDKEIVETPITRTEKHAKEEIHVEPKNK